MKSKKEQLAVLKSYVDACIMCDLCQSSHSRVVGEGSVNAKCMIIGEAPGQTEDELGRPFVGKSGILLTNLITKELGMSRSDFYICNMVKGRPVDASDKDRAPSKEEMDHCFMYLEAQIKIISPKVIITLGNVPTRYLLKIEDGITQIRGRKYDYKGIPVIPSLHPSYISRRGGVTSNEYNMLTEDIKKAKNFC